MCYFGRRGLITAGCLIVAEFRMLGIFQSLHFVEFCCEGDCPSPLHVHFA